MKVLPRPSGSSMRGVSLAEIKWAGRAQSQVVYLIENQERTPGCHGFNPAPPAAIVPDSPE